MIMHPPDTPQPDNLTRYSWRHHLAAAGALLALAVWLTWPQAAVLGEAIVGGPIARSDGWQNVWALWWVRHALFTGQNPLYTDLLFWPEGVHFGFQTLTITNALISLPVLLPFGAVAAYGVAGLLNLALAGGMTYVLALRLTGSWPGALAAGLLLAAAPSHLARFMDGQHHMALHWIALYALALWYTTQRPSWRSGLWLVPWLTLIVYTSWYQALYMVLFTAAWFLYHAVAQRRFWSLLRPWVVALPLVLLLVSPLLAGFVAGQDVAGRGAAHFRTRADLYRVDLTELLLPSANHPLWGAPVSAYQEWLHPRSASWIAAPGYTLLALALLGLVLAWRQARLWGLLAGVLLLYSLGATLRVAGFDTGVPLLFQLVTALPGATFGHRLSTAAVVALVPLAVAAAFGLRELHARLSTRAFGLVCAGVLLVALIELAPPDMLVLRDDTAPLYADLRGGEDALLIVPPNDNTLSGQSSSLRAQMIHERPIVGGYVARPPDYAFYRSAAPFKQLRGLDCQPQAIIPPTARAARSALNHYAIGQVVLHAEHLSPDELACARLWLEDTLKLEAARSEGPVTVYDVPEIIAEPFLFLDRGWFDIERNSERLWRWMTDRGLIYLVNPTAEPQLFAIRLDLESYQHTRPVTLRFDERVLGELLVTPGQTRVYEFVVWAAPGQHQLRLEAPDEEDPAANRAISISIQGATLHPLH